MVAPNNPNVCKVSLIFARDVREAINTFHVDRAGGWSLADMANLATRVHTWYSTYYKQCIPTNIALQVISLRVYNPVAPLAYDLPISPGEAGTRTGTAEAANVTITMSERTGLAGRAFRGRMYVPGISENDALANDTASSVLTSLLSTAMAQLIVALFNAPEVMAVFHRPHIPPHVLDNTATQVLTYVIENVLDSQRRRLPGRGR